MRRDDRGRDDLSHDLGRPGSNSRRSPLAARRVTASCFARPFDEGCGGDSDGSVRIALGGQLAAGDECVDAGDRQTQPTGRLGQGERGPTVYPRHRCHCARRGRRGPGTFARATARAGLAGGCRQLRACHAVCVVGSAPTWWRLDAAGFCGWITRLRRLPDRAAAGVL